MKQFGWQVVGRLFHARDAAKERHAIVDQKHTKALQSLMGSPAARWPASKTTLHQSRRTFCQRGCWRHIGLQKSSSA